MTQQPDSPTGTKRTARPLPLVERDDPALHRHADVDAALCAALPLLVRMIRRQMESSQGAEDGSQPPLQGRTGAFRGR